MNRLTLAGLKAVESHKHLPSGGEIALRHPGGVEGGDVFDVSEVTGQGLSSLLYF
jgi:hypothetical protein